MIVKKEIKVQGMHCGGCETIIEDTLNQIDGVTSVKADYQKSKVQVSFDADKTSLEFLQEVCSACGYPVISSSDSGNRQIIKIGLSILALVFLVFVIFFARNSGSWIRLPEINSHLSDGMIVIVGLLTGFHCVGMCGSFILGYTTKDAEKKRSSFRSHLLYGTGKTISYALFGAIFGFVGSLFQITPFISGISIALAGTFLILYGLNMLNIFSLLKAIRIKQSAFIARFANENKKKTKSPFFIGFFTGFILGCGPLQAMYIMAAGNGNALEGAKMLALFGLGTLPALFGFGLLAQFLSNRMTRNFIRVSGIILIILGSMMLNKGLIKVGSKNEMKAVPACCQEKK